MAEDPFLALYEIGWFLEPFVFLLFAFGSFLGLRRLFPALSPLASRMPNPGLGLVRAVAILALLWFWLVLQTGAASDIVGFYTWLYVLFAFSMLTLAGTYAVTGLHFLGDVVDRANLAAGVLFAGFALGTAFAFGGALTGEGPGWWVVAVFFVLAYVEVRSSIRIASMLGGDLAREVRAERDLSAAALLAGVAVSAGLVAGRAAAGDFLGWEHGLDDYAKRIWPLLVVAFGGGAAAGLGRLAGRSQEARYGAAAVLVVLGLLVYFLT